MWCLLCARFWLTDHEDYFTVTTVRFKIKTTGLNYGILQCLFLPSRPLSMGKRKNNFVSIFQLIWRAQVMTWFYSLIHTDLLPHKWIFIWNRSCVTKLTVYLQLWSQITQLIKWKNETDSLCWLILNRLVKFVCSNCSLGMPPDSLPCLEEKHNGIDFKTLKFE